MLVSFGVFMPGNESVLFDSGARHSSNQKVQTKKALTGLSSLVLEAELAVTFKMLCAPC